MPDCRRCRRVAAMIYHFSFRARVTDAFAAAADVAYVDIFRHAALRWFLLKMRHYATPVADDIFATAMPRRYACYAPLQPPLR